MYKSTAFWIEQTPVSQYTLIDVFTHTQLYSLSPPGKKYHSKVTCQGTKTKAKARIWKLKGAGNLCQTGRIFWDDTAWGDDAQVVLCGYYIRKMCIVFIQFQELTGRPVKAVCNGFQRKKHSPIAKGFPLNAARNISAYAAALHVYFNLLGNLSGGAPSRRKEPIWSSVRTDLLMQAWVKR